MDEELGKQPNPPGVQIVIRGGIRRVGGGQATTQTMSFRLQDGETLDLRFALPGVGQSLGGSSDADRAPGYARVEGQKDVEQEVHLEKSEHHF